MGLKSTAFIEHWSWYAERFIEGGCWITPDEILVNDNLAFSDAVSAGLSQEQLITIGNPHLEKIADSSGSYKANGTGLRDALAISGNTEVVLFLSEELQMDFGNATVSPLGYTEYEALSIILETLKPNQKLYIKLHPSEKPDKYLEFLPENQIICRCELEDLLGFADHVVGMATMLLIEMSLLGERVISLRPNSKQSFVGETYGLTIGAQDKFTLRLAMENQNPRHKPNSFMKGASSRLKDYLVEYLA